MAVFHHALDLARMFDAHLSVIIVGINQTDSGFYYAGAQAIISQENLDTAKATSAGIKDQIEIELAEEVVSWDVTCVSLQSSRLRDFITTQAQFSDLLVLPSPYGIGRNEIDVIAVETGLFDVGMPVLIIPDNYSGSVIFNRILLAWNGGREAQSAARKAIPFIAKANKTDIVIIDLPVHTNDRSDPGGQLALFIIRHGGQADITILARSEHSVSDTLNRVAMEKECNLIVMGAYGHSRMREAIIGGATRDMLEKAQVPVLMAR